MDVAAAVPTSIASAAVFSISAVFQQRAARSAPDPDSLRPRLLLHLVKRPLWLIGVSCLAAGYVLQAVALSFGNVALVEPLIMLELVFAVPLAMRIQHRWPGKREWLGAVAVVVGAGGFVRFSSPSAGHATPAIVTWFEVAAPCALVCAGLIFVARGPRAPRRAALLAVVSGIVFGLLALVTKSLVTVFSDHGLAATLSTWQLYVIAAVGVAGVLVAQSAYQAAPLAISLPIIDSLEPLVAVTLAVIAFGERVSTGALATTGEIGGACLAVVGVFLLGRSPLVLSIYEREQRAKHDQRTTNSQKVRAAA